jgi:hypothetical protein
MTNLEPTSYKWKTTESISIKIRNEIGLSAFSAPIQYSFGIPRQINKTRARNERYLNKQGRIQTIPFCR